MLKPGTLVSGSCRLQHLIAEGGMAEIYLAERTRTGSKTSFVAIKRLLPHLSMQPAFAQISLMKHGCAVHSIIPPLSNVMNF